MCTIFVLFLLFVSALPLLAQKEAAPINQTVRFGLDYQFRGAGGTENPYYLNADSLPQFVEFRNGGHSLGMGMEGFTPFGTVAVSVMMPVGGSILVGDSDTGTRFKYRNASVWNFHIGPGLMSKRGWGIYAGYCYKYHYLNFKQDVRVPNETVSYVREQFFARTNGGFLSLYAPIGKSFLFGLDFRGGGLKEGFGGGKDSPKLGGYNEFSVILFPHSKEDAADGLYIRFGAHGYNLDAPFGGQYRTGGGFFQIGISYTIDEFTEMLQDTQRSLIPPPVYVP